MFCMRGFRLQAKPFLCVDRRIDDRFQPDVDCKKGWVITAAGILGIGSVAAMLALSHSVFAQTEKSGIVRTFTVASVRQARSDSSGSTNSKTSVDRNKDGLKLSMENATLMFCIQRAYGLLEYQVSGPEWLKSKRDTGAE